MTFSDIQKIFNRAFLLSFSKKKLLFTFFVLVSCGLLAVFCRGLGVLSGNSWISLSLAFLPIFLSALILLFSSVLVIRIYHDEIKNRQSTFFSVFKKSFDVMLSAASIGLPLVLIYLLFWITLGVFFLLKDFVLAFNSYFLFHHLVLMFSVYALSRNWGCSKPASVFSAVTALLGGYFLSMSSSIQFSPY